MAIRIEGQEVGQQPDTITAVTIDPRSPTGMTTRTYPTIHAPSSKALQEIEVKKAELLSIARSLKVSDQTSFQFAASLRQDVRKATDTLEALMRPNIQRLHETHKAALEDLKRARAAFDEIERLVKRQQDDWQTQERRRKEEERRALEAEMMRAREKVLAQQLEIAAEKDAPEEVAQVLDRMSAPPPSIPMVHVPVKAQGASARTVPTFTLKDPQRIDPQWVMKMVMEEISRVGECEWLMRQIRKEISRSGKRSEKVVGVGSIEYDEVVSTGVRR